MEGGVGWINRRCTLARHCGRSGRDQRERNLQFIYRWLATFHFTTRALLTAALRHRYPPVRLLRASVTRGVLVWYRYPTFAEPLLMLTAAGKREAGFFYPEAQHYRARPGAVYMDTINHDLAVQRVVLAEDISLDDLTPARLIERNDLKTPDALFDRDGRTEAIEVELTVKSHKHIYIAFGDHLAAMSTGEYAAVRYLFAQPSHCATYRALFDAPAWPRYVYARAKRAYLIDPTRPQWSLAESPGMADRFSFSVHPALAQLTHRPESRHAQAQTPAEEPEIEAQRAVAPVDPAHP